MSRPEPSPAPERLPFGPYSGLRLSEVAVMDPAYLLSLLREGVGPAALRAEAARELARRGWSAAPAAPAGALRDRWVEGLRGLAPWLLGALLGLALLTAVRPAARWAERGSGERSTVGSAELPDADPSAGSRAGSGPSPSSGGSAVEAPAFDPDQPCGARARGAIPASSAADFLDSFQAVEFEVVGSKDTGRVTFLNSHDPYIGHFYVAIFPDDYGAFAEPPARHFRGRCVLVQGRIEAYRGTPQIVLREPGDIRILDPPAETPAEAPAETPRP